MRVITTLGILAAAYVLVGCGPAPTETPKPVSEKLPERKCPDVNNRDTNDPCSPLYFKKKGSRLPDTSEFK
jgi:hypothetical protein